MKRSAMLPEPNIGAKQSGSGHAEVLIAVLKELTGITIPPQKTTMVMSRLRKRLAQLNHPHLPDYAAHVRCDRAEQQVFINLLTTNETSFFRTPRVWKYFREQYLPEFQQSKGSDVLRIWSAAASTGEEAFSIAMTCNDHQLRHRSFRYQVLATDVDTEVLAKAKSGQLGTRTVEKLRETNPEMFYRYFKAGNSGSPEANAELLRNIQFARHNLLERLQPHMWQDVVFLRNALIYFRETEQIKILEQVALSMRVGATLILGESEAIGALDTPFKFIQPQIYRKSA
ncbi:MAG: protein-glutamate O-methyltransferase CheR [Acidobacteriaceae bacterium]